MQTLKERIIAESNQLGIDKIGFTTAEPFDYLEESLLEQRSLGHTSGSEHQNIKERLYPEKPSKIPKALSRLAWHIRPKYIKKFPEMKNVDNLRERRGEQIIISF